MDRLILDKLYPVGSIYLETTNTNSSSKLGGTWIAYGASDTYLRLGGNGSGGNNSVKPSANQIPSLTTGNGSAGHTHSFSWSGSHNHVSHNTTTDNVCTNQWRDGSNNYTHVGSVDRTTGDVTIDISGTTSGASVNYTHTYTNNNQQNVSITPKYVQVYAWKRTA